MNTLYAIRVAYNEWVTSHIERVPDVIIIHPVVFDVLVNEIAAINAIREDLLAKHKERITKIMGMNVYKSEDVLAFRIAYAG